MRGLVSCTGAQFCGLALIETKNRALAAVRQLEQELDIPRPVRIHWTGCPNSCGQAQVGDIGLMGSPAKLNGKAVEGVRIMVGGKIGENPKVRQQYACSRRRKSIHMYFSVFFPVHWHSYKSCFLIIFRMCSSRQILKSRCLARSLFFFLCFGICWWTISGPHPKCRRRQCSAGLALKRRAPAPVPSSLRLQK